MRFFTKRVGFFVLFCFFQSHHNLRYTIKLCRSIIYGTNYKHILKIGFNNNWCSIPNLCKRCQALEAKGKQILKNNWSYPKSISYLVQIIRNNPRTVLTFFLIIYGLYFSRSIISNKTQNRVKLFALIHIYVTMY